MVAASMQVWKHSGTPCSWQRELHITGFIPAKKDEISGEIRTFLGGC